ncbi:MAG: phage antirepressor N-terminal domain-containing protein [Chloroflexota bacterium]
MAEENKALVPVEQKQVMFYEDEITAVAVQEEGRRQVYVPVRPVCDQLGIAWSAQRNRINRDPVLSEAMTVVIVTITTEGATPTQSREMLCLPLDYLNGWLFGINASRVKEAVRDRLIRYQRECYQVLYEAFQEGRLRTDSTFEELLQQESDAVQAYKMALAVVKLARNQIMLEARLEDHEKELAQFDERLASIEAELGESEQTISEEQASQISQAVKAVAITLGKQTNRNEFGAIYGELYRRYGLTSYKLLPRKKFEDAMKFLTDWHQSLVDDAPF